MAEDRKDAPPTKSPATDTAAAQPPAAQPPGAQPDEMTAGAAFGKGMNLLWRAARTAARDIQQAVDMDGVKRTMKRATSDIEHAAKQAAEALEEFADSQGAPKPVYTQEWPPDHGATSKQVDADVPPTGGVDESGVPRDVRIQVDDDGAADDD